MAIAQAGDDSWSIRGSLLAATETTEPRETEMEQHADDSAIVLLAALVGEWSMVAEFEEAPPDSGARRA